MMDGIGQDDEAFRLMEHVACLLQDRMDLGPDQPKPEEEAALREVDELLRKSFGRG